MFVCIYHDLKIGKICCNGCAATIYVTRASPPCFLARGPRNSTMC